MFSRVIHAIYCVSVPHSFYWQIIFHIYWWNIWIYIYIYLMDGWVVPTFLLLWIMLLWTFLYKFWCRHVFSILLDIYLGMEWLGRMVTPCLIFWGTARLFPKWLSYFAISSAIWGGFQFFYILTKICYFLSFWSWSSYRVWRGISFWLWFVFLSQLAILHVLIGHLDVFFGEMSVQIFCHLKTLH